MKFLFTLYDTKAERDLGIMAYETRDVAIRALRAQHNAQPTLPLFEFPDDYILFEIGMWDGENMVLSPQDPFAIGSIRHLLKPTQHELRAAEESFSDEQPTSTERNPESGEIENVA